jgi:YfiH family protein
VLTNQGWEGSPELRHGFLDRHESAAAGDARDWGVVLRTAGVALPITTARQVHGASVAQAPIAGEPPEADAVITAGPGLAVGVVTADCVPAVLVARRHGVAAAVHAGWRGAAAGVLEATLARLRATFDVEPSAVEAALGPAIGPCCYRVGAEVRAAFEARTGSITTGAWTPDGDRLRLDLRAAARLLLEAAGVARVTLVGPCTACTPSLASYRRDGAGAGRQLSFVGWADG